MEIFISKCVRTRQTRWNIRHGTGKWWHHLATHEVRRAMAQMDITEPVYLN